MHFPFSNYVTVSSQKQESTLKNCIEIGMGLSGKAKEKGVCVCGGGGVCVCVCVLVVSC